MDSFSLVLFGATGDLARLKIFPAIYDLKKRGLLPENFGLIGGGRTEFSKEGFGEYVGDVLKQKYGAGLNNKLVGNLVENCYYIQGDLGDDRFYEKLEDQLEKFHAEERRPENRIFHLAILPHLYREVVEKLGRKGLAKSKNGWVRILLEKPFGSDLESAKKLDLCLKKYFSEEQIYRIDHYLAKETVQNIVFFRFANELFEPTMSKKYVDHIQISMLEEFGIRDRGKFYDRTGAVRDVLQNHLLQLLATVTMDRPEKLMPDQIRASRQKLLTELVCPAKGELVEHVVRGQYRGYLKEKDVERDSDTETFVAVKALINNERWAGVPVYIRAGKLLCRTVTEVSVVYKDTSEKPSPNILSFRIQPDESIVLRFYVTKPGPTNELQQANLQFHYHQLKQDLMEAYQRVLLDSFLGNQTLFTMSTGVEAEWKFVDPILNYWKEKKVKPKIYEKGGWGPSETDDLLRKDEREWIEPSVDLEEE